MSQENIIHALFAVLIGLVAWLGKTMYTQLKSHVDECNRRAVENASLIQWVGDGMHSIADKVGASLPPKPE